ncbi:alpha/beta fold hydrolase [Oerskovia jenensis]|uniref:Pimeloyl-ACP methyl ester carboxylesterase n=1 Tax=Oerskovia jenensis TaxID=162169 RepID=A0ABS2LG24_9CELL|nr:alpha/beta hydrolase [Oerskovia jenensis]MBM7479376.1 pimeloyl-ACP methyl ester carboxylesterase [Oerskovia jenensis]
MTDTPAVSAAVPATIRSLRVPGAALHHEVRGQGPLVALVGAPMDADAFAPLADLLAADHTVLTTDPRGIHRSTVDDPDQDTPPEVRADDLARLLAGLDAGPATVVGSSGGAVTALALAQSHPDLVRTVVAHEAPLDALMPDRERLHAATRELVADHRAGDVVGAWRKFFAVGDIAVPDGMVEHMFGGERDPQQVADERFWFAHDLLGTTLFEPDVEALRASPVRVVVGVGEDSTGQLCDRTSSALAALLGTTTTLFPGDHTGFVDDPSAFAQRLRTVLRTA